MALALLKGVDTKRSDLTHRADHNGAIRGDTPKA